jgi:hypothetical protein
MATPPQEQEPLMDWRDDPRVHLLDTEDKDLRTRQAVLEAALSTAKAREAEAPSRLISLWEQVYRQEKTEADVDSFEAEGSERTRAIHRIEGELRMVKQQLTALAGARTAAQHAAQREVADRLKREQLADAQALYDAYQAVIAISTRMNARQATHAQQFPQVVYGQPRLHAPDIKPLEPLYDADFVPMQRGILNQLPSSPWDRLVLGPTVRPVYDRLRAALGMPEDRGELTVEGALALKSAQEATASNRELRARRDREAIAAAKRAGALLPSTLAKV